MNRTITTTSATRRLRHAALALCALAGILAASCTDDPSGGIGGGANPGGTITLAVGPRPGFTEAAATLHNPSAMPGAAQHLRPQSAAPATRAGQTPGATRWEQGDILWLAANFYRERQNTATHDTSCISALKYDGDEWRYLTPAEADAIGTGSIPRFSRLVRRPRGSEDWADPGIEIHAFYTGSGKPGADGTITITPDGGIPDVPLIIETSGMHSLDIQPVPLTFGYFAISRVRIPAGYKVELTDTRYWSMVELAPDGKDVLYDKPITEIPAQPADTNVFLWLFNTSTATLTRGGVSCSFTFEPLPGVADILFARIGASYTLTPYTSGAQTPAGYDLTIADEAGLRAFADSVNAGGTVNGKPAAKARVLQTADITLTAEWVPIGYTKGFRGAYNGNGHTITGLTITTPPANAYGEIFAGLFGGADEAVLTGIRLQAVEINIRAGSGTPNLFAGSIVGILHNSTLSLCSADGTVNADGGAEHVYAGGIAGTITSIDEGAVTISRCRADAGITAATTHADGVAYAGGIAGENFGRGFILCCETGSKSVTAGAGETACAGGITGRNIASSLIAFCRTGTNAVKAQNGTDVNYAGGLVGENVSYLYSCYSRAVATAAGSGIKRAGAIVGYNYEQEQVQHCYAAGATDQGTSNLATGIGIVYKAIPTPDGIFGVMTNHTTPVESVTYSGKTCYPYTTHYDPSATPAYGIIPLRAVWNNTIWQPGDGTYPEIDMGYEGE